MIISSDLTAREPHQLQGAQARAQRENHRLPLRGSVATPGEVATTERALAILLRAVANMGSLDETVRAGVTVRLMLDLGRDAGQLAQLWRLHLDTDDNKRPGEWGLVSWVTEGSTKLGWWLPAGVHIDSAKGDNGESARGAVWLPVLERSRPWLERAGLISNPEKRPLIGRSQADVQRDVATFLSLAKATLGSLGHALPRGDRLPGAFAEQLAWQPTGDRTLANQLSGKDMKHSVSRSYYSSLSTPKAARYYAKAMPSAVCDLSAAKAQNGTSVLAIPKFAESDSTRKDPKGALATMQAILKLLPSKPDRRRKDTDIVEWHTALVSRVWILLALSTAIRPLTNWVPGLQRIEPRTGGLIVLDKDRKDGDPLDRTRGKTPGSSLGRARMVFLHPTARSMLRTYLEHLRYLGSRDDIEVNSRDLIARHVEGLSTDALLPFLELSWHPKHRTLIAKEVGPAWIEARLKRRADVPANFARHTLRSGLMGQVPQSAIDAMLGHFDVGTEPWTNGSALDPVAYRALLTAVFEGHFKAAGEFTKPAGMPEDSSPVVIRAELRRELPFDAGLMPRFWTLENDFLAALADTEADLSMRRNRLLVSGVLFGGLLNPDKWGDWLKAVMGPLRGLAHGERLEARQTRAVFVRPTGFMWFADPITESLLARPVVDIDLGGRLQDSDYARLARLSEEALVRELKSWVLPAAKIKMTLLWPPLVIEHSAGALRSKSLGEKQWDQLDQSGLDRKPLAPLAELETLRREPRKREPTAYKAYWLKDKGFQYIRKAIFEAIQAYAVSDDPTLALERAALKSALGKSQEWQAENTLGWFVYQWFLQHCPDKPHLEVTKPGNKRARTLYDHVFTLGNKVDWSDLWLEPLTAISPQAVEQKLHEAVRHKPEGFGVAKQLYSFLGFGTLSRPADVVATQRESNIKSQILSGPQFHAVLGQIHDKTGNRGAHWLAAMLMFRCGLRTREIVAMEIDHITLVDGMVELKVAATPYVALKNRTSARVLPLHALLSTDELAELLKWRGQRVRDSGRERRLARLLFETIYDPSDYDYLFDPIEAAIRKACDLPALTSDKSRSAAYIFSRCSALRHSFVSYAVTTMLFPRDDGGFPWPVGITPDLVSLGRRERLERALLAEGHLGLSSLEAVRQMTGHASFKRTLGTYTHIMDLVAGAYCWRRSSEPSLPAEVVCELSAEKLGPATLSSYARQQHKKEQKALDVAVTALRCEDEAVQLLLSRARRPRGRSFPSWMPQGNAFLSQIRPKPVTAVSPGTVDLPEWRTDAVSDWYILDQIVQMASRAIPASVIADEFGVRREVVERLARRYHQLISVRRRTTKNAIGTHRHRSILEEEGESVGPFDAKNGCWYAPIKRLPKRRQDRTDLIWTELQCRRGKPAYLEGMRDFLSRHQDGRVQAKSNKSLEAISGALRGLLSGLKAWPRDVVIKHFTPPTNKKGTYELSLKFESKWSERDLPGLMRWPATTVMLHLLLLAEAASQDELPDDLVVTPVVTGLVDVGAKIRANATKKSRKASEAIRKNEEEARATKEAQRKADEEKKARKKAERRDMHAQHNQGKKTFEVETRGSRTRHGTGGTPRRSVAPLPLTVSEPQVELPARVGVARQETLSVKRK